MDRKSVLLMMMLAAFFIMATSSHLPDGFTSVPSHDFGRNLLEERHRFSSSMDRHEKRDVQALLSFKDHIKEDPAGKLSNWTAENSKAVCSWYGITCRENTRRIVAIILPAALVRFDDYGLPEYRLQLQGTLSPSLGNLSLLDNLNLSGNNLTGRIPPELGQLKALRIFDLFWNWLERSIPKSISNCTRLRWIDLSYNFLTGTIPTEFGRLVELEHLNFSGNYLGGSIPASLSNCTSLREFSIRNGYWNGYLKNFLKNMRGNNFSGPIPSAFGLMKSLSYLDLGGNNFSGPIPSFTQFSTFNATSFLRNKCLWGCPLDPCNGNKRPMRKTNTSQNSDVKVGWLNHMNEKISLFALAMGLGIGFWGVLAMFIAWKRARNWLLGLPHNKLRSFYGVYRFPT